MDIKNQLAIVTCILVIFTCCNDRSSLKKPTLPSTDTARDPLDAARDYAKNFPIGDEERQMSQDEAFDQFHRRVKLELPPTATYLNGIYYGTPGETGSTIMLEIDPKEMERLFDAIEEKWTDPMYQHLKFGKTKFIANPGSPAAESPLLSKFGMKSVKLWLTNEKPEEKAWVKLLGDPETGLFLYSWSRP